MLTRVLYDRDIHSKVKSRADFWFLNKLFLKWFIFKLLQHIAKCGFLPCFEIIVTLMTLIFAIPSLQILLLVQGVSPDIWRLFWSWTLLFWVLAASFTTVAFAGTEELFVRLQLQTHLQKRRTLLNWCLGNISFSMFRTIQK